jgi:MoaD family protein
MHYTLYSAGTSICPAMKVKVRIFGDLAPTVGHKHVVELNEEATILTLMKILQERVGQTRRAYLSEFKIGGPDLAIIVNGKNIALLNGLNTVLSDGDDIVIMPFISGG